MGRAGYDRLRITGAGGINQQQSKANPEVELLDATNVWAPDGAIVGRPGYVGTQVVITDSLNLFGDDTNITIAKEDVTGATFTSGTGSMSLTAAYDDAGDRFYIGFAATTGGGGAVGLTNNTPNTLDIGFFGEYYNGTSWVPLDVTISAYTATATPLIPQTPIFNETTGNSVLTFVPPKDWALTSVDSTSLYWIRITWVEQGSATITSNMTKEATTWATGTDYDYAGYLAGVLVAQLSFSKRYLFLRFPHIYQRTEYLNSDTLGYGSAVKHRPSTAVADVTATRIERLDPPTIAVVPQFEEFYVAYDHFVAVHKGAPATTDTLRATVETDSTIVGTGEEYDPAEITQLSAWPEANYIMFFKGTMWAAGLRDSPFEVRWSAPQPNYKVWPTLNVEVLMENDNSPISGMVGYQEHATVFKNDSIWKFVDSDTSDFGLQTYAPIRVVNGIGCVSNGSIVEVRNRLIFLSEDGIYSYDGTSEVEKLSDNIQSYCNRITPGRRKFASACNWKRKSLYMLAVSLDGSAVNTHVLVFDYKNGAWWVWDNIEAEGWLVDEDAGDEEVVYFFDSNGWLYQMGVGLTDHGRAITHSFETHRIGYDGRSKVLRNLAVAGLNVADTMTVEAVANDLPLGRGTSATLTFTDSAEKQYGTAVYETDTYTEQRDRLKSVGYLLGGQWFQAKVSHTTKNTEFGVTLLEASFVDKGQRR